MVNGAPRICRLLFLAVLVLGAVLVLFAAGVRCLYGGEADEAIRFMETEPMQEPMQESVPEASTSAMDRERALEVLKAIVGVSGANYFGTEGHKSKQFGVHLYVPPVTPTGVGPLSRALRAFPFVFSHAAARALRSPRAARENPAAIHAV